MADFTNTLTQTGTAFRESRAQGADGARRAWLVGSLIRAIADSLESRFNPVTVEGEIAGFSRAGSGHCYFSLKDEEGQIRCAMFRRAASLLDFTPRDGQRVELRGRLGVYEPRGELQLVAESMREAGQGILFEQFARIKTRLEAEGLFDPIRKRVPPAMPHAIGIVTSLGAAALHDVTSALQRRAPHIPIIIYHASVQGSAAASQLCEALLTAYRRREVGVILLVRGGGAIEDLWPFNDEQLARTIVQAPVPIVSGVGHETDFTITDFCADLRAPTPTAAAELCAQPRDSLLNALVGMRSRLADRLERRIQVSNQRLDMAHRQLNQRSLYVARQHARLAAHAQSLAYAQRSAVQRQKAMLASLESRLPAALERSLQNLRQRQNTSAIRLDMLSPEYVLKRGYVWLADECGAPITSVFRTRTGQAVRATLADGEVDLTVLERRLI